MAPGVPFDVSRPFVICIQLNEIVKKENIDRQYLTWNQMRLSKINLQYVVILILSWGRWDCEDKTERHIIAINRQPKGGNKTLNW